MKNTSSIQKILVSVFAVLLLLSPLSAGGAKEETPAQPKETVMEGELDTSTPQVPQQAPAAPSSDGSVQFLTLDIYGQQVTQEVFASADITMLNVWGTYCSPCIREMPDLGAINREYADKGFQIVGIVIDGYSSDEEKFKEQLSMARAIADYTQADYPHLLPISIEMNEAYLSAIQVVPTTFFVDSKGNILGKSYEGSRTKDSWLEVIDGVLSEYGN